MEVTGYYIRYGNFVQIKRFYDDGLEIYNVYKLITDSTHSYYEEGSFTPPIDPYEYMERELILSRIKRHW